MAACASKSQYTPGNPKRAPVLHVVSLCWPFEQLFDKLLVRKMGFCIQSSVPRIDSTTSAQWGPDYCSPMCQCLSFSPWYSSGLSPFQKLSLSLPRTSVTISDAAGRFEIPHWLTTGLLVDTRIWHLWNHFNTLHEFCFPLIFEMYLATRRCGAHRNFFSIIPSYFKIEIVGKCCSWNTLCSKGNINYFFVMFSRKIRSTHLRFHRIFLK